MVKMIDDGNGIEKSGDSDGQRDPTIGDSNNESDIKKEELLV